MSIPVEKFDLTKINTPYAILAILLLISESLLAIWYVRTDDAPERCVAGGIMALILHEFRVYA